MLNQCVLAVTDTPFTLKFTAEPTSIEKGKGGKVLVEATRDKSADADIAIAPLFVPPTAPATPKPVAKGQTKGEIASNGATGDPGRADAFRVPRDDKSRRQGLRDYPAAGNDLM